MPNTDDYIGVVISDVARLLRTEFDRRVRKLGITRSQWLVLTRLHRNPGASHSELADMLAAEIGRASQLRLVAPDRLYQLLRDLRIGSTTELDPATVRRIAEFGSADTVAAGRFEKLGDQIRINVSLHSPTRLV